MADAEKTGKTEKTEKTKKQGRFTKRLQESIANRDFSYITRTMYEKNLELANTNRTLGLLREIDVLALASSLTLEQLCQELASAIRDSLSSHCVAMFIAPASGSDDLFLEGWASEDKDRQTKENVMAAKPRFIVGKEWADGKQRVQLLAKEALKKGHFHELVRATQEVDHLMRHALGNGDVFAVKLEARQEIVGVMLLGFEEGNPAQRTSNGELLIRLGDALGIAIDSRILLEENARVLRKLQQSNAKLRALDEAKDEFISMASHQLRTPLTSVKGYISMIMDGDVGAVTPQQKQMLDQAFISSQRMVYLIADLLNVSRLRTGKFVIEAKPTFLPDVIEGEISQLYETAKAKNLELAFDKPKDFPQMNLDETKIRQVIMNFTDNSVYYTPAGGHIKVALEATDKAITFSVSDDGIGVPKREQHHLFSKFYRAGNARKARPDGTGLGLFMAKKVVVAQGGAIIFTSTEGKGSTFGFTFPRDKLEVKPGTAA